MFILQLVNRKYCNHFTNTDREYCPYFRKIVANNLKLNVVRYIWYFVLVLIFSTIILISYTQDVHIKSATHIHHQAPNFCNCKIKYGMQKGLMTKESGQTLSEYALVITIIMVACTLVVTLLGNQVQNLFVAFINAW